MKGICTHVIKHNILPERVDVEDYPTDEIIAALNTSIEEGMHAELKLNDILTLRDVKVDMISPGTYSLAFEMNRQDDAEQGNYVIDALAAMLYAQKGFLPVTHVVDTLRQRVRTAVPENIRADIDLKDGVILAHIGGKMTKMPLGIVYTQHLLTGPMVLSWSDNELRMSHNMPTAHEMEQWFTMHNQTLLDGIEDMPEVAACCLVCTGVGGDGRPQYAYMVALMNGSCVTTAMDPGQIFCMVKTGKCPEVDLDPVEGQGINLTVYNDELLPEALPFLDQITDYQLGLTARL